MPRTLSVPRSVTRPRCAHTSLEHQLPLPLVLYAVESIVVICGDVLHLCAEERLDRGCVTATCTPCRSRAYCIVPTSTIC
jgi:hypothetical protein